MIFDTHAHYDDKQFDQDREELLASMKDNGIGTIVDVGSNMETSTWIVEAVTRYPMMYGAVGVHPRYGRVERVRYRYTKEICSNGSNSCDRRDRA